LLSVATALPPHRVDQRNAKQFAAGLFGPALGPDSHRLLSVFDHSGIESRHVCMPLEWYERPHRLGDANALYLEHALELAAEATQRALDAAGLTATQVDHLVFVSSTGFATPSLDARLANRIRFRDSAARVERSVLHARAISRSPTRARWCF
jgi:alkylresorcinol/alkylpyrone synthase